MATPLERLELEERFLSGLLAFVPPSLYLPRTDAELDLLHERSGLNARFWKRSSTEANVKLAMKNKSKKAKRRRYEAEPETLAEQIARRAAEEKLSKSVDHNSDSDDDEDSDSEAESRLANTKKTRMKKSHGDEDEDGEDDAAASSPMDGLRQRLQARIALLRKQRETDGKRGVKRGRETSSGPLSTEEKQKLKQQRRKAKKLKRVEQQQQKARKEQTNGSGASGAVSTSRARDAARAEDDTDSTIVSAPYVPEVSDLQFSAMSGLRDTEDAMRKKRMLGAALNADSKGGEKKKRMRKLLEEAEKKQRRMQELRESGVGLGVSAEAWDTTLKRAAGDTVKDDPKLLRKAMKRMERAKQKSKSKWSMNTQQVKDSKDAAQDKRRKNLKAKEDRQKAKRAGKSLPETGRAGFEGQVNGKLNGGGHPAVPSYSMKRGKKHRGTQ